MKPKPATLFTAVIAFLVIGGVPVQAQHRGGGNHGGGGGGHYGGGGHAVPRGSAPGYGSRGGAMARQPRPGTGTGYYHGHYGSYGHGGNYGHGGYYGHGHGGYYGHGHGGYYGYYPYSSFYFGFGWPYYSAGWGPYYAPYYASPYYGTSGTPDYGYYAGAAAPTDGRGQYDERESARGYESAPEPAPFRGSPPNTGRLRLEVRPEDASVYVDDEFWGSARESRLLTLRAGRHTIELVRPGFATVTREVEVTAGEMRDVLVELQHP